MDVMAVTFHPYRGYILLFELIKFPSSFLKLHKPEPWVTIPHCSKRICQKFVIHLQLVKYQHGVFFADTSNMSITMLFGPSETWSHD